MLLCRHASMNAALLYHWLCRHCSSAEAHDGRRCGTQQRPSRQR